MPEIDKGGMKIHMTRDEMSDKPLVFIPYEFVPESKQWKVGNNYRVTAVLKQIGTSKEGALFELADAYSLEPDDKGKRKYLLSSEGSYRVN